MLDVAIQQLPKFVKAASFRNVLRCNDWSSAADAVRRRQRQYMLQRIERDGYQPLVRHKGHGFLRSAQMNEEMLAMIAASAMRNELSRTIMYTTYHMNDDYVFTICSL